jgi:hypothetical protein
MDTNLSIKEQINLFRFIFRGREDVFDNYILKASLLILVELFTIIQMIRGFVLWRDQLEEKLY